MEDGEGGKSSIVAAVKLEVCSLPTLRASTSPQSHHHHHHFCIPWGTWGQTCGFWACRGPCSTLLGASPLGSVAWAATASFSRLVWTHLTTHVWQNPSLDGPTAQTLVAVANAGCGVAVAFSIFTFAFYIFLRWGVQAVPLTLNGFGEECGATPGLGEGVPLSSSTCQCLLSPSPVCGSLLHPFCSLQVQLQTVQV